MISDSIYSLRIIADAGPRSAAPQLRVLALRLLAALIVVFAAISVLVPCVASARDWPAPTGYVNDYAKIIDAASADSIEALGKELQEKTGAEMAVVTLPDLGGEEIEPAATELFSR